MSILFCRNVQKIKLNVLVILKKKKRSSQLSLKINLDYLACSSWMK